MLLDDDDDDVGTSTTAPLIAVEAVVAMVDACAPAAIVVVGDGDTPDSACDDPDGTAGGDGLRV